MKKLTLLFCFLLSLATLFAQSNITVSGVVTDKAKKTIPGASIVVKKTRINTVTDNDGRYTIQVPADGKLVFSSPGYKSQKIAVKNHSTVDVLLEESTNSETVVVGYGVQKKEAVTGAIAQVKGKDIKRFPVNPINSLNQVTGVQVIGQSPALSFYGSSSNIDYYK